MKTEGRNAVLELLETDKNIDKILMEKGGKGSLSVIFAEARKKGVRVQYAEKAALDKESETGRHQGVIAYSTDYEYYDVEDIIANPRSEKGGFVILCDGVEDVHNLGSVIRVAECAGADGVIITKAGCAPVNESVIRGRGGAHESCAHCQSAHGDRKAERKRLLGVRAGSGRRGYLRAGFFGQRGSCHRRRGLRREKSNPHAVR